MEKSFDLGSVLRKHQKKHKVKPMQFESVAGGVLRRMENSLKQRKSSRLTSFDCTRNLPLPSPVPESEAKQKAEHRRQQLQKWKVEKERKKKELAAKKVKPFVTGVAHNPMKYVPPPPARAVPSSSGCVTRSQAARNQREESKKVQTQSFAPINAGFRAPQIKNLTKFPKLDLSKPKKDTTKVIAPVLPAITTVTTRSRAYQRIAAESKAIKVEVNKPKSKVLKPVSKPLTSKSRVVQSSSSSENESQTLTSSSSSYIDLTAKMVSSSEDSNILLSTENDSVKSHSLESSSSCELISDKAPISKRKSLHTPTVEKTLTPNIQKDNQVSQVLFQSEHNMTPPNRIPRSESSSEERLRSPKSPVNPPMTPEQIAEEFKNISPCVTMSRGKDNARKEMKKKIEEGLLDDDASNMESVEHFQRQLASEINRITEICNTWDKIYEQVELSESIQGQVLGAVGQARLLMSQKMQQFAQLIQRCARPEPGATLVTAADLRGFWDMVFIQVENVEMRFKELEELKARDWVEAAPAPAPPAGRRPRAPRPAPAKPRPAGNSRLRDMIAAARKAKAQEAASQPPTEQPTNQPTGTTNPSEPCERSFEAGFFSVRSPARSPRTPRASHTPATPRASHTPATPRNSTLLKAVLSHEAVKASASKQSASFAMLRASVLGKSVECDGIAPLPATPLPQIDLSATPGRSILKQSQNTAKSSVKQIKVVLFNQSDDNNTSIEDLNLSKEALNVSKEEEIKVQSLEIQENAVKDVNETLMPVDDEIPQQNETKKINSRRSSRLTRQDAVTEVAVTRRTKKNMETPQTEAEQKTSIEKKTPKRSARKKMQVENIAQEESQTTETPSKTKTPRRSIRQKGLTEENVEEVALEKKTPSRQRSARKKALAEIESNIQKEFTPMRSTRRKKTEVLADGL